MYLSVSFNFEMQKLTLELDYTYALIGIHSPEEDYRLAYLINKNMATCFSKHAVSLDFEDKNACFSIFVFEDTYTCTDQYLISNKHTGSPKNKKQNTLFTSVINETTYLIPEYKNVDYFLKIEGDLSHSCLQDIVNKINKIPQILTSYTINTEVLNSRDALIF